MSRLKLWAIAFEIRRGRRILKGNIDYVQDVGIAEAKLQWRKANPNYSTHYIVAVGPVIGYKVKDKQGQILSV